jgi:hypothetical protein
MSPTKLNVLKEKIYRASEMQGLIMSGHNVCKLYGRLKTGLACHSIFELGSKIISQ